MKKDIFIAVVAIAAVIGISFAIGTGVTHVPPAAQPVGAAAGHATASPNPSNVVMRVNGEPVTDREFALFVQSLPEQAQAFAVTGTGRREIANQLVKMKVLEQQARKLGAENDPDVVAKMDFGRTNVFVEYALVKIASAGSSEAALRAEYEKNKASFGATELSHIVIAYQGGAIQPRAGEPLPLDKALQKAMSIEASLRGGTPFEEVAKQESDDQSTAANGGKLGPLPPGALPPEIQSVVDKLQPGEISAPVRSQFGIHIFRLDSRRPQSFDEVKALLQRRVQQGIVTGEVDKLQKAAKVELDPKFFSGPEKAPRG